MRERLPSLAFLVGTAYRASRWRTVLTCLLIPTTGLVSAAIALWLKLLADAALAGRHEPALLAALALAATASFNHSLAVALDRMSVALRERMSLDLEARLLELAVGMPGLEHHELPEYLDRLEHLRMNRSALGHGAHVVVHGASAVAQVLGTILLLASVHPVLVLLPLLGLPPLLGAGRAAALQDRAEQETAVDARLADHYLRMGSTVGTAKEVRLFDFGEEVVHRHREALERRRRTKVRALIASAGWAGGGSGVFVAGYIGAIALVIRWASLGRATPGDLFLVLKLASQINGNVTDLTESFASLQQTLLIAGHFRWFAQHAEAKRQRLPPERVAPAPTDLRDGIAYHGVSFRYPGTDVDILHDVDLFLPAGKVVALVGENGAGKTTLIKLLCGFYTPTSGKITVDGIDLHDIPVDEWRKKAAGAFQDFCKFEFTARETVGLGDLPDVLNERRIMRVIDEAGARESVATLPDGLATQLGRTFDGADLSEGQWQKLALARSRMRRRPLFYLLDEPTASLDPESEYALFSLLTAAARRKAAEGAITLLVSHRLSTVRDADLIVVLDQGRIVERGSHSELLASERLYAELFALQASAYQ
ncbi:MAG: ABC transporter ATP-binding protein/permease [Actinomycetota bacterium]|nr:ABC transporter ATP-binding protein/permease [Actinomycetota bacterium]